MERRQGDGGGQGEGRPTCRQNKQGRGGRHLLAIHNGNQHPAPRKYVRSVSFTAQTRQGKYRGKATGENEGGRDEKDRNDKAQYVHDSGGNPSGAQVQNGGWRRKKTMAD